jgi:hypothetical protein
VTFAPPSRRLYVPSSPPQNGCRALPLRLRLNEDELLIDGVLSDPTTKLIARNPPPTAMRCAEPDDGATAETPSGCETGNRERDD